MSDLARNSTSSRPKRMGTRFPRKLGLSWAVSLHHMGLTELVIVFSRFFGGISNLEHHGDGGHEFSPAPHAPKVNVEPWRNHEEHILQHFTATFGMVIKHDQTSNIILIRVEPATSMAYPI